MIGTCEEDGENILSRVPLERKEERKRQKEDERTKFVRVQRALEKTDKRGIYLDD